MQLFTPSYLKKNKKKKKKKKKRTHLRTSDVLPVSIVHNIIMLTKIRAFTMEVNSYIYSIDTFCKLNGRGKCHYVDKHLCLHFQHPPPFL